MYCFVVWCVITYMYSKGREFSTHMCVFVCVCVPLHVIRCFCVGVVCVCGCGEWTWCVGEARLRSTTYF